MRSNRDEVRLRHMLDHAREAVAMARDHSETDLAGNRMLELSLVRLVEIIGEAAARVSDEARERHAQVPWPLIAGVGGRTGEGSLRRDLVTSGANMIPCVERVQENGFSVTGAWEVGGCTTRHGTVPASVAVWAGRSS